MTINIGAVSECVTEGATFIAIKNNFALCCTFANNADRAFGNRKINQLQCNYYIEMGKDCDLKRNHDC